MKTIVGLAAVVVAGVVGFGATASAHTDSDIIAVPARSEATVKLKPTHGCAGSPTIEVAIQAPVEGATAGDVEGWTATATPGGEGKTVLEWKGGSLPADQTGEFPVTFTAPDAVGELLTFPAVQVCENGDELSWISGDPADDFPAPRLLILAPGSEAAGELEEIPADAPGRNKLTEVADVDNPAAPATTTTPASSSTTSTVETTTTIAAAPSDGADTDDEDDSSPLPVIAGVVVVAAVIGGAGWLIARAAGLPSDRDPPPGTLVSVDRSKRGALAGITAAVLFGASTPLAKQLLGDVPPQLLAGLLYGGAALALSVTLAVRRSPAEARLRRSDAPILGAITLAGGVVAPVLLLIGLERVSGVAGSLLLNLEAVATLALALLIFGEHLDRRAATGAAAVVVAAGVLGFGGGESRADALGVICIAAACLCWAVDNNLTQRLSGRDPFAIVRVKAAVAATVNLTLAVLLGAGLPAAGAVTAALVVGGAAYGLSVVLDAYALRWVGAAREAAYFGTAPLFGVITAVLVLNETISATEAVAMVSMAAGVYLLVTERHEHAHRHTPMVHDHRHRHDDGHHDHGHPGLDPALEHAHSHVHSPVVHTHGHVSDAHHRHDHGHPDG